MFVVPNNVTCIIPFQICCFYEFYGVIHRNQITSTDMCLLYNVHKIIQNIRIFFYFSIKCFLYIPYCISFSQGRGYKLYHFLIKPTFHKSTVYHIQNQTWQTRPDTLLLPPICLCDWSIRLLRRRMKQLNRSKQCNQYYICI